MNAKSLMIACAIALAGAVLPTVSAAEAEADTTRACVTDPLDASLYHGTCNGAWVRVEALGVCADTLLDNRPGECQAS